jgi:RNA polymerase sigma factor for flagellar operon FliA
MRAKPIRGMDLLVRPPRVEASLWRRLRADNDSECRETLFNRYVGLARTIAATHYFRRRIKRADRTDFEQFAFEGLLQAIDRFDPLLGVPFSAFARRRIAGSIAEGAAQMSEVDAQISHRHRMERERLRSLVRHDGKPPEDALAALSGLAMGLALGLMLEGTGLMDAQDAADLRPNPYESLEWRQMQRKLVREVVRLPEKEAVIIRQHYENGLRFAQIADLLELSPGRVSQLHRSALERLRKRIGALSEGNGR